MADKTEPIHFVAVDDDRMILDAISSILEAAGHRVTAFSDSKEAMEKLPGIAPDCIICLLYTSPSPRDQRGSRMPSSA